MNSAQNSLFFLSKESVKEADLKTLLPKILLYTFKNLIFFFTNNFEMIININLINYI